MTTGNCYTDTATTQRQPLKNERLQAVLMARATLLRSRMRENSHVRF